MRTCFTSKMQGIGRAICVVLLLSLFAGSKLSSQQFLGTITGTVADPTGAVINNASLTAVNTGTKAIFKTVTTTNGLYTLPALPIGHYALTVEAAGFEKTVQEFDLHGNDRLQINLQLQMGSMTQTITVSSAELPLLETTTGDSGLTVGQAEVHDLPMLARNAFTLATMAPGVYILPGQDPKNSLRPFDNGGFDGMEVNGGRPETIETTIDGLADTALDTGSATSPANIVFVPSPDMVTEFRNQTSAYDAQSGRSGGGFISVNLKSGTNQLHGAFYEYNRNSVLNANDYSDNRNGIAKPPFHWNEPGLEIDGPVLLPKLYNGRDKTFFMFGWEDIRTSTPAPVYETVPTALEKSGDFSQSYNGGPLQIYDPLTTVSNGNGGYTRSLINPANTANPSLIPAGRIDPVAAKVAALLPAPNVPGAGNVSNLYSGPNNVVDAYDAFTYRVDQNKGATHHLSFTYMHSSRHQTQGLDGYPIAISPSYLHYRINYGAHVNWTWMISPTLVSNFGIGWNEHRFAILNHQATYDLSSLSFPSSQISASPAPTLFPRISIASYTAFGNAGLGTGSLNTSDNYDLRETLIKTFGAHSLSFGGEIRPMHDDPQSAAGNFTFGFGTDFTQANPLAAQAGAGSGFASFLLGYADSGSAVQNPARAYRDIYYALFVQDNWRVTNRLTLNLGLRWDTESPQTERHNEANTGFDPNAQYTFAGKTLTGVVLFPASGHKSAYDWDRNNFGPRFGAAYHLTPGLVLRGGIGMLFSPTFDVPSAVGFSATTTYLASNDNLLTPALPTVLSNPYPDGFAKQAGAGSNLNGMGGWTYWPDRERNIPRTLQFSFGFEKQLPKRAILDMRYVGQLTSGIVNSRNPNFLSTANLALGSALNTTVANPFAGLVPGTSFNGPTIAYAQTLLPYPQYIGTTTSTAYTSSAFTASDTNGTTNYHGLQVRFEKAASANLHFLVSYTFAKSMVTGYLNNQDVALRSWIDHYNIPQILTISAGYSLLFFAGSDNRLARQTLGGWSINGIFTASSGELYAAPSGLQATGASVRTPHPTTSHEFNTCTITTSGTLQHCDYDSTPAWSVTMPYTLNNLTPYYGGLTAPIPPSLNLSIFKSFDIYERVKLQFRAESFNLANTAQFGAPDITYTDSTFGARTNWAQVNDPRNIQLALRLTF